MNTDLQYIVEVPNRDERTDVEQVLNLSGYTPWWSSLRKQYDEWENCFLCVYKNKEYSYKNLNEVLKSEFEIISHIDFYRQIAGLKGDPPLHFQLFKTMLNDHNMILNGKDLQRIEDALYL